MPNIAILIVCAVCRKPIPFKIEVVDGRVAEHDTARVRLAASNHVCSQNPGVTK